MGNAWFLWTGEIVGGECTRTGERNGRTNAACTRLLVHERTRRTSWKSVVSCVGTHVVGIPLSSSIELGSTLSCCSRKGRVSCHADARNCHKTDIRTVCGRSPGTPSQPCLRPQWPRYWVSTWRRLEEDIWEFWLRRFTGGGASDVPPCATPYKICTC